MSTAAQTFARKACNFARRRATVNLVRTRPRLRKSSSMGLDAEWPLRQSDLDTPMNAHERPEARLRLLLSTLADRLRAEDVRNVEHLVDHDEGGIALEILCTQLFEFDAMLRPSERAEIQSLANLLEVDVSYLSI